MFARDVPSVYGNIPRRAVPSPTSHLLYRTRCAAPARVPADRARQRDLRPIRVRVITEIEAAKHDSASDALSGAADATVR